MERVLAEIKSFLAEVREGVELERKLAIAPRPALGPEEERMWPSRQEVLP